jgi:hypothetical protein
MYFAAPRMYMGVSPRMMNLTPVPTPPYLFWSIDTVVVSDAANAPP